MFSFSQVTSNGRLNDSSIFINEDSVGKLILNVKVDFFSVVGKESKKKKKEEKLHPFTFTFIHNIIPKIYQNLV